MKFFASDVWRLLSKPRSRYVLSWLTAAVTGVLVFYFSWTAWNSPKAPDGALRRRSGNKGHTLIDFGGQWLMGRMFAKGLGPHLYHRSYERLVLEESYPRSDEIPPEDRGPDEVDQHDVDDLMNGLMGKDDPESTEVQLGGPLYPPIQGLVMYPFGLLEPAPGYRLMRWLITGLAIVVALGVRQLSDGRIWWPVALTVLLVFPGFFHCLALGQNGVLMLCLLTWGWLAMTRGRPIMGGVIWGLLAFKPVWAASFFLIALLSGRYKSCAAMLITGAALALATLPFVGIDGWRDWLQVGSQAAQLYDVDENWVFLARDLLSIPRRWLLDFSLPIAQRPRLAGTVAGWALYLAIFDMLVWFAMLHPRVVRTASGPSAAFLFLGAWLCCYHFMFYDVILAYLPIMLLLMEPSTYWHGAASSFHELGFITFVRSTWARNRFLIAVLGFLLVGEFLLPPLELSVSVSAPFLARAPFPQPVRFSSAIAGMPWSTFCFLVLWLYCGKLSLSQAPRS